MRNLARTASSGGIEMWWTYVLTLAGGMLIGMILSAIFASNPRDEKQEEEDFYKAMRELKEKKEKKNAERENKSS